MTVYSSTGTFKTLAEGFAYCEIKSASLRKKNNDPIVNTQGQPLVMLSLSVTDSIGTRGWVQDFICVHYVERFKNFENAFGVTGVYRNNHYFLDNLIGKNAGCVLKIVENTYRNPPSLDGKVVQYIPLSFYTLMTTGPIAAPVSGFVVPNAPPLAATQTVTTTDDDLPF